MATLEVTTFNKQLTVKTISKWYTLENNINYCYFNINMAWDHWSWFQVQGVYLLA